MTIPTAQSLKLTGFQVCNFLPDQSQCEHCSRDYQQLYFRSTDYWDEREGDYFCADCVEDEGRSNATALLEHGLTP